jgi:ABC-type transport system involved in multi-copper enzyme maturation permease subunit
MLRTIIRKEILEYLLTFRFPLFFIICVVLIPISLYVNSIDYSRRVSDHNEQTRLAAEGLSASRMYEIQSGVTPLKGFRPPSPLSIFATGFELSLPRYFTFSANGAQPGEASLGDESLLSIFGRFDFLFIVQMVISLMVLLLASDLVAGEKDLGTLRGVLSNSVPRHTVLIGKLIGGFAAVWLPFAVACVIGLIVLSLMGFPLSETQTLLRIAATFIAASCFILVYFTIGLMVSASVSRARTSLVAILLVWIICQLLVPRVSDMAASVVYPIRTGTVVSMQKSLVVKSLEEEKAKILGRKYVTIFGTAYGFRTDLNPPEKRDEWNAYKRTVDQQFKERKAVEIRQIDDAFANQKQTQRSIAATLSLLSPSAAFTRLVTDLCGTGEIDRRNYQSAVESHQQSLDGALYAHVNKTTLILPGGGSGSTTSYDQDVDLAALPAFSVRLAAFSDVITGNQGSFISLAFWLIVPFALAYVKFLRYDVR